MTTTFMIRISGRVVILKPSVSSSSTRFRHRLQKPIRTARGRAWSHPKVTSKSQDLLWQVI